MVEISKFYDVDIYTIAGQYVGRVADVVLNIKYGTISRLIVKASVPEKRNAGIMQILSGGFGLNAKEEGVSNYQESLVEVSYDKVKAIGDIMLIDPQGLFRKPPEVSNPTNNSEEPVQPNQNNQSQQAPQSSKPIQNENISIEKQNTMSMNDNVVQSPQNPEIRKVE